MVLDVVQSVDVMYIDIIAGFITISGLRPNTAVDPRCQITSLVATNLLRPLIMVDNSEHGPNSSEAFSATSDAIALSGRMILALVGT